VRGAGLEPARYHYHQPLKLACLPFHHPRTLVAMSARADEGHLFVEGAAGAGPPIGFGSAFGTNGLLLGGGFGTNGTLAACFDITLEEPLPKMLPDARCDDINARYSEVAKNNTASALVARVSTLPAPLAPNTVLLEPPNIAPTSAPLPCWSRIMITSVMHTVT
jgi:hypothetical protein